MLYTAVSLVSNIWISNVPFSFTFLDFFECFFLFLLSFSLPSDWSESESLESSSSESLSWRFLFLDFLALVFFLDFFCFLPWRSPFLDGSSESVSSVSEASSSELSLPSSDLFEERLFFLCLLFFDFLLRFDFLLSFFFFFFFDLSRTPAGRESQ